MTKDYAKKKRPNYSSRSKNRFQEKRSKTTFWSWIGTFLGLLLGTALALLIYWHGIPNSLKLHPQLAQKKVKKEKPVKERRFDFYTVLPTTNFDEPTVETVAQAATTTQPQPEKQKPAEKSLATESFIIQVGSFRSLHQAEELKAELALSGMEARIQTFRMGAKDTWHRVYLGPFTSKQQAELKLKQLNPTQVRNSLVIKNSV